MPPLSTGAAAVGSSISEQPDVAQRPALIVVGDDAVAALCAAGPLATSHGVERIATLRAARTRVAALPRGIVVTELTLPDGNGVELCAAIKSESRNTVVVLVLTSDAARVPRALAAGCDSVLLKPFPPNLLHARIGRLARELRIRSAFPTSTLTVGTNEQWPELTCPVCGHAGPTTFDATSLRRAWYACLACEHVWIAKRQQ
jgi:two-component system, OmpR family, response regulator MtrA